MKKLVSIMLVAAMCLSMLPTVALAGDPQSIYVAGDLQTVQDADGGVRDAAKQDKVRGGAANDGNTESAQSDLRVRGMQPKAKELSLAEVWAANGGANVVAVQTTGEGEENGNVNTEADAILVVGGVTVNDENAADVLGDGKVKYDADTQTLTLTNANISSGIAEIWNATARVGIYSTGKLNINLVGTNSITVTTLDDDEIFVSIGIFAPDLTVSGSGSLTVTAGEASSSYGILVNEYTYDDPSQPVAVSGNLIIEDGVTLTTIGGAVDGYYAYSTGIYVCGSVQVGDAKVTAKGGTANSIYSADSEGITVHGTIYNHYSGLWLADSAEVTAIGGDATVSVYSEYYSGAYSAGIWADCDIQVDAATVVAKGGVVNAGGNLYVNADSYGIVSGYSSYLVEDDVAVGGSVEGDDAEEAKALRATLYDDDDDDDDDDNNAYYIYMGGITLTEGANVTATGGKATGGEVISNGLYAAYFVQVNDGAKLNATGADLIGFTYASTCGVYCDYYAEFADDSEVVATAGKAIIKGNYDESYAYSRGICVCDELVIGAADVTGIGSDVSGAGYAYSGGVDAYGYWIYNGTVYECLFGGCMTIADGANVSGTAGNVGSEYEAESYGIHAYFEMETGKATLSGKGGNAALNSAYYYRGESYGVAVEAESYYDEELEKDVLSDGLTIGEGAKVTATGGKVTAVTNCDSNVYSDGICSYANLIIGDDATVVAKGGEMAGYYCFGNGVYAYYDLVIGEGAKVTATGGNVTNSYEGESCGVFARNGLVIGDGAEVNGTGGNITATADDYYGEGYSRGILGDGGLTIGKDAKVTGSTGNVTVRQYAMVYGIRSWGDIDIDMGAEVKGSTGTVTAIGPELFNNNPDYCVHAAVCGVCANGSIRVAEGATMVATSGTAATGGDCNGYAYSYALYVYNYPLVIEGTVVATAGTAYSTNDRYYGFESCVYSYGTYVDDGIEIAKSGVLKTTGGTATYIDPGNSANKGKYVNTDSCGICIDSDGSDDEKAEIYGSLLATGGNSYSTGEILSDYIRGGDANSSGVSCYNIDFTVKGGANVKLQGGHAEVSTTCKDSYACCNGLWINGANLIQEGGALYVASGSVKGGEGSDIDAIEVWSYNLDDVTYGGRINVNGGWCKVVSDDLAILAEESIEPGTDVGIVTPTNGLVYGEFEKFDEEELYTVVNPYAEGEEPVYASTVLIWDGKTDEFEAPVINVNTNTGSSGGGGGGGGSSKNNTTTKEEEKNETKTDEVTGETENDFIDVKPGDYFAEAVKWATENKVTSGATATTFEPYTACTRAQMVTFLWRVAGSPVVEANITFTDVDENAYYAEAIRWAASKGIVDGYGEGIFAPNDTVTREQVAAILFRFAKAEGMDTTQGGMQIREFNDYESISEYAIAAMQWAVNAGVMQGYDNNLTPAEECSRAQIVTMLYRLLGK